MNPIGIGVVPSTIFAGFADGVCALMVLLGLFSRYAAFFALICLNTVWWLINNGLKRLLWLPIPAAGARGVAGAGRMGQIAGGPGGPGGGTGGPGHMAAQGALHVGQAAAQGAQHVGEAAAQGAQQLARVVHSLPNYLNVPIYILGFLVIFIAGPGRYSLDKMLEAKMRKKAAASAD